MSKYMEFQEKRKHKRTEIDFDVDYYSQKLQQFRKGKNISLGGMFIETPLVEPQGTKIKLTLTFQGDKESMEAEGTVIWSRQELLKINEHTSRPCGIGIIFTNVSMRMNNKINSLM